MNMFFLRLGIIILLIVLIGITGCMKPFYRTSHPTTDNKLSIAIAYYERGLQFEQAGNTDSAIAEYKKANEISPRPVAYYHLGLIYAAKADYPTAIAQFEKALDLVTTYIAAQQELDRIKNLPR